MQSKSLLTKKLIYRSCNRGCKETDFLLSEYAKCNLKKLTQQQLADYDHLISQNDNDIYSWLTLSSIPPDYINQYIVFDIINFNKLKYVS